MTSTRIWLTCAFVTAAVVAGILLLTDRRDAEANGRRVLPRTPPALSEQEIRTYLDVWPRLDEIFRKTAYEFGTTRRVGQAEDPTLGDKGRAEIEALLQGRHLTWESWLALSGRVEGAVNTVRAAQQYEEERPGMEARIELNKDVLKSLPAADPKRKGLEKEIEDAEALIARGPPAIAEKDRQLVLRYWEALRKIVPTVGPPPR